MLQGMYVNLPRGELASPMGDFPSKWVHVRDLREGGQGHTYIVRRSDGSDAREYVLKRLKNSDREAYFEREIEACEKLEHPNVLKIIEHGRTPKDKPYLITPYCDGGSLDGRHPSQSPLEGLRFFRGICDGVAHAHDSNVFHLDIKPPNIFLRDQVPVVGDFGICFIAGNEYIMTSEGPRGSLYYCAPELRGPEIEGAVGLATADVYSLGKVLYWIFTGKVYDGHQTDYSERTDRHLAELYSNVPEFTFIDEIVEGTVQLMPEQRILKGFSTATNLRNQVQTVIDRIEARGRPLDLTKPLRCLFCAHGLYKTWAKVPHLADRLEDKRGGREWNSSSSIYQDMRNEYKNMFGSGGVGTPVSLVLVCQHCGNVQTFRFDLTPNALGVWKP